MAGLEVLSEGPDEAPAVLLVAGLGEQLTRWPPALISGLLERGRRVIRVDNRDVGLSEGFDTTHTEDFRAIAKTLAGGEQIVLPYTLDDMADDLLGVLDMLKLAKVHFLGVSLGAMIAQAAAAKAPERVAAMTLVMTTSGRREHINPSAQVMLALISGGQGPAREQALRRAQAWARATSGPKYPADLAEVEAQALAGFDRAWRPGGVVRQLGATLAAGDQTPRLGRVTAPVELIHGLADPLLSPAGAQAVADALPCANLALIEGLGHYLAGELVPDLLAAFDRAETRALGR